MKTRFRAADGKRPRGDGPSQGDDADPKRVPKLSELAEKSIRDQSETLQRAEPLVVSKMFPPSEGARATISFSNSAKKMTLGVNDAEFRVSIIKSIPFGHTPMGSGSVGNRTYVMNMNNLRYKWDAISVSQLTSVARAGSVKRPNIGHREIRAAQFRRSSFHAHTHENASLHLPGAHRDRFSPVTTVRYCAGLV